MNSKWQAGEENEEGESTSVTSNKAKGSSSGSTTAAVNAQLLFLQQSQATKKKASLCFIPLNCMDVRCGWRYTIADRFSHHSFNNTHSSRQAEKQQQATLAEDPNAYAYDTLFDDMQSQKQKQQQAIQAQKSDRQVC